MTRWSWTCAIKWEAEEEWCFNLPASGLRSSVVSVCISLILDSLILDGWVAGSHDIKLTLSGDGAIKMHAYTVIKKSLQFP